MKGVQKRKQEMMWMRMESFKQNLALNWISQQQQEAESVQNARNVARCFRTGPFFQLTSLTITPPQPATFVPPVFPERKGY